MQFHKPKKKREVLTQQQREEQNQPFINPAHDYLPQPPKKQIKAQSGKKYQVSWSQESREAQKQAGQPVNKRILEEADRYSKELPSKLNSLTEQTIKFMLEEVAPPMLSVYNGMQDAKETLQAVLQTDPNMQEYTALAERYLMFALRSKLLCHIVKITGLDEEETRLTMIQAMAKDASSEELQRVMNQILNKKKDEK
jgi:paraquat-inducible protein B